MWLWFPELFNKLNIFYTENPEASVGVCDVTDYKPTNHTSTDCIPSNDVFLNSFLISISALPGNVWTIVQMDKLGRKFFLGTYVDFDLQNVILIVFFFVVLSMVLSGGCVFFIYLVRSEAANLALSCAFGFVSTMGFNSLDCLGIELFPTHVRYKSLKLYAFFHSNPMPFFRSTAMAVTMAVARIGAILGNVIFGYFIEVSCAVPVLMVSILLISGGLTSLKLPNTTRTTLA